MRILPLLVAAAFVLVAVEWLAADAPYRGAYQRGSSLAYTDDGLSQARAYLAQLPGMTVSARERPLTAVDLPPARAVLLRVNPADLMVEDPAAELHRSASSATAATITATAARAAQRAKPLLTPAEETWVEGGGRLVLAVEDRYANLETGMAEKGDPFKTLPVLPGVRSIAPPVARTLQGQGLAGAATVFAMGSGSAAEPVIARRVMGAGEVWLLSCPEILDNRNLANADHLALLIGLVAGRSTVLFDEAAHGLADEPGAVVLLRRWGLGPALLLLAIGFAAVAWRRRVILGVVERTPPPPRVDAIDGIAAIGALYARAVPPREALDAHHRRLLREVQARMHLKPEAARAAALKLCGGWSPDSLRGAKPDRAAFHAALARINRAFRSLREQRRPRPRA